MILRRFFCLCVEYHLKELNCILEWKNCYCWFTRHRTCLHWVTDLHTRLSAHHPGFWAPKVIITPQHWISACFGALRIVSSHTTPPRCVPDPSNALTAKLRSYNPPHTLTTLLNVWTSPKPCQRPIPHIYDPSTRLQQVLHISSTPTTYWQALTRSYNPPHALTTLLSVNVPKPISTTLPDVSSTSTTRLRPLHVLMTLQDTFSTSTTPFQTLPHMFGPQNALSTCHRPFSDLSMSFWHVSTRSWRVFFVRHVVMSWNGRVLMSWNKSSSVETCGVVFRHVWRRVWCCLERGRVVAANQPVCHRLDRTWTHRLVKIQNGKRGTTTPHCPISKRS